VAPPTILQQPSPAILNSVIGSDAQSSHNGENPANSVRFPKGFGLTSQKLI